MSVKPPLDVYFKDIQYEWLSALFILSSSLSNILNVWTINSHLRMFDRRNEINRNSDGSEHRNRGEREAFHSVIIDW